MIKNKIEILQFIRQNPSASKRETADKWGISVPTVSRFRKMIQAENLTKPNILTSVQARNKNTDPTASLIEFECIRKCYWNNKLYQKGEIYLLKNIDIPHHFRVYVPGKYPENN